MVSEVRASWQEFVKSGLDACSRHDYAQAQQAFSRALDQAHQENAPEHSIGEIFFNLGWCHHALGDYQAAEQRYKQAQSTMERQYGPGSDAVKKVAQQIYSLYKSTNRADEAEAYMARINNPQPPAPKPPMPQVMETPREQPQGGFVAGSMVVGQGGSGMGAAPPPPPPAPVANENAVGGYSGGDYRSSVNQAAGANQPSYNPPDDYRSNPPQTPVPAQSVSEPAGVAPRRRRGAGTAGSADLSYDEIMDGSRSYAEGSLRVEDLVHRREVIYGRIALIFSIYIYFLCTISLIGLFIAPLVLLAGFITNGLHLGNLRARGIRVSDRQFPEVYRLLEQYCTELRMEIPEVYVVCEDGLLNAFARRLHGKDQIVVFADVLEMAYEAGERELAFVVVHELAHVKLGHVKHAWLRIPGNLIPFLGTAYSRACEYSCDRIARKLVPDGALFGLVALAAGTKLYRRVNLQSLYEQAEQEWGFWAWFHEIQSSHPNLVNRIRAIGIADQDAKKQF